MDNKEAVKQLKKDLGLNNNYQKTDVKKYLIQQERCTEIYHALENFCSGCDEKTLPYLTGKQRGLNNAAIKKFRLFTITKLQDTLDFLFNSYDFAELKASGLFNEDGRFVFCKHRIIIPYLENDSIDYLRGRLLPWYENTGISKYIGLSGKSAERLFNLNTIKDLKAGTEVLVCEGEFDAMRAEQEGLKAVGVPGVNNFPGEARDLLKDFNTYLCFDNYAAGKEGIQKITNILNRKTMGIFLQKHKDLTEFFNQTGDRNFLNKDYVNIKTCLPDRQAIEPEKKSKIKPITASELQKMKIPPLNWIIEDLIPEGLSMLAGMPRCGKSWLALGMALSAANGAKALNKFPSVKSSVLYIALGDSNRRMQDRINKILGTENNKIFPNNLLILHNDSEFPKLNEGGLEALTGLVEDYKDLRFIIIDTLGRSIKAEQAKGKNNYLPYYELMSKLQRFAVDKKLAVLLIHHTKKGKEDNPFDEISGTTGITDALDAMLMIKKSGGMNYLHFTGKDVIGSEYLIEFDQNSFIWKIIEEKDEKHYSAERLEIIDLFEKYGRHMKTGEVAKLLGKEKYNISKLIKKLVDDGILRSPAYGSYELIKTESMPNEQTELGDLIN